MSTLPRIPQFKARLWCDLETRSRVPITTGSYTYSEDSEPLLFLYALDDAAPKAWCCQWEPVPDDLNEYMRDSQIEVAFHNLSFDLVQLEAWRGTMAGAYGWDITPERMVCTMEHARLCGLPGSLEDLCVIFGLPDTYSKKDGKALIQFFCVPQADGTYRDARAYPEQWNRFVEYGIQDVIAMRAVNKLLPQGVFNKVERLLSIYTTRMNNRGIPVDRPMALAAIAHADKTKRASKLRANDALREAGAMEQLNEDGILKQGEFNPASQKAIIELCKSYGVFLEDARSATVEALLDTEKANAIPEVIRKVLNERFRTHKTSVSKYTSLLKCTSRDGRARGLVSFGGAGRTARDSGRRFQPQNLARPVLLGKNLSMDQACDMIRLGYADALVEPHLQMQLLSDAVRGVIAAPPGRKFCDADLASIEGRVLPWMAGEDWKVQYFRDLDAGIVKYDDYELSYGVAFGVAPETVTRAQRNIGKPIALACGFSGGVGGLLAFCAVYHIDPEDMSAKARVAADPALLTECTKSYEWYREKGLTYGLSAQVWAPLNYIITVWRMKHPNIQASWKAAEEAFRNAIRNPNTSFAVNKCVYRMEGKWLFCQLPSGRLMCYPNAEETDEGGRSKTLQFQGINQYSRKWSWVRTYAGKLVENVVQSCARDVLFWNIPHVENAGYEVILRIHDQLLCETPDTPEFNGEALAHLLRQPHSWCTDLPLNAEGETRKRFGK
jgi:DNA polymerase bacteriophage-type